MIESCPLGNNQCCNLLVLKGRRVTSEFMEFSRLHGDCDCDVIVMKDEKCRKGDLLTARDCRMLVFATISQACPILVVSVFPLLPY